MSRDPKEEQSRWVLRRLSAPEGYCSAAARFVEDAPSAFDLANLITVADVDRGGDEAGFTSYGAVHVYANGYEVESYLPGGDVLPLSGTSMAAPQVTNLAAKLLALKPDLTVGQLRDAILAGAEEKEIGPSKRIKLLHPRRSLELMEEEGDR